MVTKFTVDDDSAEHGQDGHGKDRLAASLSFRDQKRIYLEHDNGVDPSDRFQDMKNAIKATYEDNMEAQKKIDKGDFELLVYDRRVLPQYWSFLIQPEMSVRIRLGSDDDDSEPEKPSDSKVKEKKYTAKSSGPGTLEPREEVEEKTMPTGDSTNVTYRVDYYLKSRYSSDPDKFLHSNYYDAPVAIEFKKGKLGEHSIIEEVKTITFGDSESITVPKKGSKAAPKLGKRDVQGETMLHVHSASLLNALRAVVKYSSNASHKGEIDIFKEGVFPYPYRDLFHYKEELVAYKQATVGPRAMHTSDYNEECDRHIDILIEYLYNEPTIQLAAFEAGLKKATPTVTFAGFWLLVKPGCNVYVSEENQLNAYVVDEVGGGIDHASYSRWAVMPSSYSVRVWSLVFDGKIIRRKSKIIQVPVFDNELDIMSLPVFPAQFHDALDGGARRKELIARDYVDISGLDEPRIVTDAIDQLVLRPESNKLTIKAIAKTYTDNYDSNELFKADWIRGKGEGQIFLLHGPPGTGKTLTAESIAEFTRRPLLSITAADLGHQPDELEFNLLRFFKNAKLWDGIVLLDEADVYLERRSTNDLMRNSIVSVGHFDEAFLSRIHVSIGYEPLDNDARVQIWDGLFRKLIVDHKNGGPEITFEREAKRYVQKDEDVRALKWNGREIRNAFQTAVALAVFEANDAREKGKPEKDCIPEITETHLAQVVRMSTAFKQYIKDTHEGLEDADLAMKLGNRDDRSVVNT
ncbi:MAG: hypothetical protein Q9165_005157 [Trypethelium subeluteriae]